MQLKRTKDEVCFHVLLYSQILNIISQAQLTLSQVSFNFI